MLTEGSSRIASSKGYQQENGETLSWAHGWSTLLCLLDLAPKERERSLPQGGMYWRTSVPHYAHPPAKAIPIAFPTSRS